MEILMRGVSSYLIRSRRRKEARVLSVVPSSSSRERNVAEVLFPASTLNYFTALRIRMDCAIFYVAPGGLSSAMPLVEPTLAALVTGSRRVLDFWPWLQESGTGRIRWAT